MNVLDAFKLAGKVALVTGARTGLGQAIAVGLAEAGADVAGVGRTSMEQTQRAVESLGRRFVEIRQDLSTAGQAELAETVAKAVAGLGRLDILVNNAGIIRRSPAMEFSERDWDEVIRTNLRGAFFLSQAAGRQFVAQRSGGKIINVASMLSFQGGILVAPYTASKSALAGLTRELACEWAHLGINVNAIAPGYMETDNTAPLRKDAARSKAILDRIPAGRWGKPDDLKGLAVFLASAASDYLHGYVYAADGGWLAR